MTVFQRIAIISLALVSIISALPHESASLSCTNPVKRIEWRQMPLDERTAYFQAVLCLARKPAISGIEGTITRYDDFVATHYVQTPYVHLVGHFILWHRYFIAAYEKALREECEFKGSLPYWNWSLDAQPHNLTSTAAFETEIFSPTVGFGGDGPYIAERPKNPFNFTGTLGGGCVQNGPFVASEFKLHFPPSNETCLKRDFMPWALNRQGDPALVQNVLAQKDYAAFDKTLEANPAPGIPSVHGSGHFGVGGVLGQMGDVQSAAGDPLFWSHHCYLDYVFWQWQQKDLATRLNQVGGPVKPRDYSGQNVTLDFTVNLGSLGDSVTLKTLLNTEGGLLCYTY